MQGYVCSVCGFISIDGTAPDHCPVCHAPKDAFKENADAIKLPADENNLSELEQKHIPVITVVKKCGLIPEGCQDAHIKMGKIQHPMTSEHSIQHIDLYLDNKYISRIMLTSDALNPAAALHLKAESGKLSAISSCNLHGSWINSTEL